MLLRLLKGTAALVFLLFFSPVYGAESELENLEAAFIHKFINYVEWPSLGGEAFVIGVLDSDLLYEKLKALYNRPVGGKTIKVIKVDKIDPASRFDIFISKSSRGLPPGPVLTITDENGGPREGAVLNFLVFQGKLRFDIDNTEAQRRGLKINSRLLNLSRAVK